MKLKKCSCGNNPELIKDPLYGDYYIKCCSCFKRTANANAKNIAINNWNNQILLK